MNGQALGRLLKEATDTQTLSGTTRAAKLFDYGATVPTDTSEGYSTGCIFLKTDGGAGTAFYINEGTAASSAFAAVSGLTAAQEALLSAVAGTNTASKALIVDANKHIDVVETASLKLGASGSTTAVTATGAELNAAADISVQNSKTSQGAAISGSAAFVKSSVVQKGDVIETTLIIDVTGLDSVADDNDIIGKSTDPAYIMQVTAAVNGTIFAGEMGCMEVPTTGADDIDLVSNASGTGKLDDDASGFTQLVTAGGAHAIGTVKPMTALPAADDYVYLAAGEAVAGTYDAGILYVKMWGYV